MGPLLPFSSLYDRLGDTKAYPHVSAAHATDAVPSMLATSAPPPRSELRFTKRRGAGSSKTTYSVKVVNKSGSVPKAGAALAALKAKKGGARGAGPGRTGRGGAGGMPTFMTGVPVEPARGSGRSRLPPVVGVRNRVGQQDAAISGWLQKRGKAGDRSYSSSNRGMKPFQELRGQLDARKGDMRKRLKQGGGLGGGGSSTAPLPRGRGTLPPMAGTTGRAALSARGSSLERSRGGTTGGRLPKIGGAGSQQRAVRRAW